MSARLRTVPPVAVATQVAAPPVPEDGAPYVQPADLEECAGLVLGSPTRFGNMAAPVKHFIDGLGAQCALGTLVGTPAAVFNSTSAMHAGTEAPLDRETAMPGVSVPARVYRGGSGVLTYKK